MNIEFQKIKNSLYKIPDPNGLVNALAPQEVDRLCVVFQDVLDQLLEGFQPGQNINPQSLLTKFKLEITKRLENTEEIFGIKNLAEKLDLGSLLNTILSS